MNDQAQPASDEAKVMAVLELHGKVKIICDRTIPGLRRQLRDYPASALITVWRGRQLPVKREVKAVF